MEASKKRKRDVVEIPRITYDTATRIFDRLFKEDSLDGLKETVRKKLGVPSSTVIHLSQLRDGKSVDLEDDDDFEAFQSAAYAASVARVKVSVADAELPVQTNGDTQDPSQEETVEPISLSKRKKKKKKKSSPDNSRSATPTPSPPAEEEQDVPAEPPLKKRRVSFAAPSSESLLPREELKKDKKEKKAVKTKDTLPELESAQGEADTTAAVDETVEPLSDKRKRKKKRKDKSSEAAAADAPVEGSPPDGEISPEEKKKKKKLKKVMDVLDSPAIEETLVGEETQKESKSKKRARTGSPERTADAEATPAAELSKAATVEASRPKKKSKKISESTHEEQPDNSEQNDAAPAPKVAAVSEKPTESTSVAPKAKKERKKKIPAQDAETPSVTPPTDSSAPVEEPATVEPAPEAKKLKKRKSKSTLDSEKLPETSTQAEATPGQENVSTIKGAKKAPVPTETPKKSPKDSKSAPPPTTPAAEKPASKAVTAEEHSLAMAAKILARFSASKLGATAKDPAADPKATLAAPALEASSSKESTTTSSDATSTSNTEDVPPTSTTEKPVETPSVKVAAKAPQEKKGDAECPVCGGSPSHPRNKCPIMKSGIKVLRKRILELEKADHEKHADVIEEMHRLIEKKTKKPRASAVNGTTIEANSSVVNESETPATAPVSTPAVPVTPKTPAKSAPSTQPPKTPVSTQKTPVVEHLPTPPSPPPPSQPSTVVPEPAPVLSKGIASKKQTAVPKNFKSFDKDSSQLINTSDLSLASLGLPGGLLGLGDISAFTDGLLENLVRGPRPSLNSRNLQSPDSSEGSESDDLEPDAMMDDEEEEEQARRASRRLSRISARDDSSDEEMNADADDDEDDDDEGSNSLGEGDVTLQNNQNNVLSSSTVENIADDEVLVERSLSPATSSQVFNLHAGEHSFQEVEEHATSDVLDKSADDVVNDMISADIGPVSTGIDAEGSGNEEEPSSQGLDAQPVSAPVAQTTSDDIAATDDAALATTSEVPAADLLVESSETATGANEDDPIEVDPPVPSQQDPIYTDAEDDEAPQPVQSTPKAQIAARLTRSQRNKVATPAVAQSSVASSTPKVAPQATGPEPTPTTRKTRGTLTRLTELVPPPHPDTNKTAKVDLIARPTRAKAAAAQENGVDDAAETSPPSEPEPSIALTRGRRAGSVVPKTPAKTPAKVMRAASKQAAPQTPAVPAKSALRTPAKPASKAATQPSAKPPSKTAAKSIPALRMTTRTRASRLAADLEESEAEGQDTTINGQAPTQGTANEDKSVASWNVLADKSSQPDLTQLSGSEAHDELLSSSRPASPKPGHQEGAEVDEGEQEAWQLRQDPLFLYDESQQSFPYSQYPPDITANQEASPNDSEDEDEVETSILKPVMTQPRPSGPFRSLTEISSQSQRAFFAPRYSSQLASIRKPAVQDMYGGLTANDDDEESGGSDSQSDSEAERKANNSHIPQTRRAGVSSQRK